MKKLFAISFLLILGGCAGERATTTYATQSGVKTDEMTDPDYQKQVDQIAQQKLRRHHDSTVKPRDQQDKTVVMDDTSEQLDLAKLYEAYNVPIESVGPPDGISEYIGQERLQKTLGRLTCTKQTPLPEQFRKDVHYYCDFDISDTEELKLSDKTLYENLTLEEVENELTPPNEKTYVKTMGRFYCEKTVTSPSGDLAYHCDVHSMDNFKNHHITQIGSSTIIGND